MHQYFSWDLRRGISELNARNATISRYLSDIGERFRENSVAPIYLNEEPPLRSELFSADQMEQHGKALAAAHKLASGRAPDQLLTRLAANEEVLIGVCNLQTAAITANRRITPAGEWLLDNFYLIEEQIRTAKRHFPKGYSRELPRLANGPSAGFPRVYDIALETISHGDGQVSTVLAASCRLSDRHPSRSANFGLSPSYMQPSTGRRADCC